MEGIKIANLTVKIDHCNMQTMDGLWEGKLDFAK